MHFNCISTFFFGSTSFSRFRNEPGMLSRREGDVVMVAHLTRLTAAPGDGQIEIALRMPDGSQIKGVYRSMGHLFGSPVNVKAWKL